jgi:hypothetical protein
MKKRNVILLTKRTKERVYSIAYVNFTGLALGILLATIINYLENQ